MLDGAVMLDRLFQWTGLMSEPGAWQACQIAALLVFAVGFGARRRRGERALPIALGIGCAGAFACLFDPLLRAPAALAGGLREPLFRGVIVSYGALGGLVAGVVIAEKARARRGREGSSGVATTLDRLAAPMGGVVALSRLGCLVAGCDFGRPTGLPWGITYGPDTPAMAAQREAGLVTSDAIRTLPVHPTQAYEIAAGLAMVGVAVLAERRGAKPGAAFAASAGTYAALRIAVEGARGDHAPTLLGLRLAAWISVGVLAAIAIAMGEWNRKTGGQEGRA